MAVDSNDGNEANDGNVGNDDITHTCYFAYVHMSIAVYL
jgi:hypothetical protein